MKIKKIAYVSLLATGLSLALPASAGVIIEGGLNTQTASAQRPADGRILIDLGMASIVQPGDEVRIRQIGTMPPGLPRIDGFGKSMALHESLSAILPRGWQVFAKEPNIDMGRTVNWYGGTNWVGVLNRIMNSSDLMATIDWEGRELTIALHKGGRRVVSEADQNVKSTSFILKNGASLAKTLSEWAVAEGYQLSWKLDRDFMVSPGGTFQGPLVGEGGVIDQVVAEFARLGHSMDVTVNGLMIEVKGLQ